MPFDSAADVQGSIPGGDDLTADQLERYKVAFNDCVKRHGSEKGENHNCFAAAMSAAKGGGSKGVRVKRR